MRRWLLLLTTALSLWLAWALPANAVTITGTDDLTSSFVLQVLSQCYVPYEAVDEALDDVEIRFEDHHDPYWEQTALHWQVWGLAWPGVICITSEAGPGPWLAEIVAHEWCHQLWFAMGPSWRARWYQRLGVQLETDWYQDPAENFAECMRCALWPTSLFLNREPRTRLSVIPDSECREFADAWRYSMADPYTDLANEDDELRAAAGYLWTTGIVQGYPDRTVRPYQPLLKRHVALIAERMGLECRLSKNDYSPALRKDVRDAIPGLEWREERWDEQITRGQLMRLLYRARHQFDTQVVEKLEKWFNETWVDYKGVSRQPRLKGYADVILTQSRVHCVPLWLALGQCWRESQWFTTGLSTRYNCGWGIKDAVGRWGELGDPPTVGGYANYVSVDEAIKAYFRLMDSAAYRSLLDKGEWQAALDKYAPPSENDSDEHWLIVSTVRKWCESRGIR